MTPEVLRLGGVARLDPEPETELSRWRRDLSRGALDDPGETRARLAQYERGDAAIVELGIFADVVDGRDLRRVDGIHVTGIWFTRGDRAENVSHAVEVVRDRIDELRSHLERRGVPAPVEDLARLPVKIELDGELDAVLRPQSAA